MIYCNIIRVGKGRHPKKNCIKSEIGIIYLTPLPLLKEWKTKEWSIGMFETPPPPAKSEKFGRF